jgi:[ribosomal protein S5]-alanine N-acetyltransferase
MFARGDFYWRWPNLQGRRLLLRPPSVTDLPALHEALNTPGVAEYFREEGHLTWAESEQYLHNVLLGSFHEQQGLYPVITDRLNGLLLGVVGLSQLDFENRHGELGIWVRGDAWGGGICAEAAGLLLSFAFGALGMERVEMLIEEDNHQSVQAFAKLGVRREGLLRNRLYRAGRFRDVAIFSLLSSEWPGRAY